MSPSNDIPREKLDEFVVALAMLQGAEFRRDGIYWVAVGDGATSIRCIRKHNAARDWLEFTQRLEVTRSGEIIKR